MKDTKMMHPYRKRKFFLGLAEILGEKASEIGKEEEEEDEQNRWNWQQLIHSKQPDTLSNNPNAFKKAEEHEAEETNTNSTSLSTTSIVNESIQSSGQEEESFEYVEFTAIDSRRSSNTKKGIGINVDVIDTTTTSINNMSMNNSEYEDSCLHDSVTLLGAPSTSVVHQTIPKDSDVPNFSSFQTLSVDSQVELKTVLRYTCTGDQHPIELSEYFDSDRMCEIEPCWLEKDQCRCDIHGSHVDFPMLLFALQVLDEYIAYTKYLSKDPWLVEICKLARTTLSTHWSNGMELNLMDFFHSKQNHLLGIAPQVWKIIEKYWERYKQNYLHHDQLFFPSSSSSSSSMGGRTTTTTTKTSFFSFFNQQAKAMEKWKEIRSLIQVYGMKLHGAKKLVALNEGITPKTLFLRSKTRLLQSIIQDESILSVIHTGIDYLEKTNLFHQKKRQVISQSEWKIAFKAIEIHLRRFREDLHIFPCGSFSRGAVYGSVMDILVAFPDQLDSQVVLLEEPEKNFEIILQVLVHAGIVSDPKQMTRMNINRGICVIKYKHVQLFLDLKVYVPPKSWIALVYFTGPEEFVIHFFRFILKEKWRELLSSNSNTTLNQIYQKIVQVIGLEKLNQIENEVQVFELAQWDYISPFHR